MIFVTIDDPDYAGHKFGFDPDESKYIYALEKADA